jgi:hypothetical protein
MIGENGRSDACETARRLHSPVREMSTVVRDIGRPADITFRTCHITGHMGPCRSARNAKECDRSQPMKRSRPVAPGQGAHFGGGEILGPRDKVGRSVARSKARVRDGPRDGMGLRARGGGSWNECRHPQLPITAGPPLVPSRRPVDVIGSGCPARTGAVFSPFGRTVPRWSGTDAAVRSLIEIGRPSPWGPIKLAAPGGSPAPPPGPFSGAMAGGMRLRGRGGRNREDLIPMCVLAWQPVSSPMPGPDRRRSADDHHTKYNLDFAVQCRRPPWGRRSPHCTTAC